jgi:hypothetical protein
MQGNFYTYILLATLTSKVWASKNDPNMTLFEYIFDSKPAVVDEADDSLTGLEWERRFRLRPGMVVTDLASTTTQSVDEFENIPIATKNEKSPPEAEAKKPTAADYIAGSKRVQNDNHRKALEHRARMLTLRQDRGSRFFCGGDGPSCFTGMERKVWGVIFAIVVVGTVVAALGLAKIL